MNAKEQKLSKLFALRCQYAEAQLARANRKCADLKDQLERVMRRREDRPKDPADQLTYEKHVGWLDQRARELAMLAAQAEVERAVAINDLRIDFGRKTAFSKIVERKLASAKARSPI